MDLRALIQKIKIWDGTDELSIIGDGDSLTGIKGLLVFGEDISGNAKIISVISEGDDLSSLTGFLVYGKDVNGDALPISIITEGDSLAGLTGLLSYGKDASGDALPFSVVADGDGTVGLKGMFVFGCDLDGLIRPLRLDDDTEGLFTIDVAHAQIHEGNSYLSWAEDLDLDSTQTLVLAFKTDATKEMHLTIETDGTVAGNVQLLEGVTWDTNTGAQNPIYNRDRNSINTSTVLEDTDGSFDPTMNLNLNPTSLAGGTIIDKHRFGVGKKVGGDVRERDEIILDKGILYAVKVTSEENDNVVLLKLKWYETE